MISPLCCGDTYISDDIFCSRVTSGVTASIRRAVGVDVLKVDLLPKEVVSAHCEAEERGRPRTSRLGGIHLTIMIIFVQTFYSLCQYHDPPGPTLKTRFRPDCAELSQFCVVAPRSWYKWCRLSAVFAKGKNKRLFFSCSPSSSILPSILQMALLFKRLYSCITVWNHTLVWTASPFWYSWPSWGFFTLTQGLDFLVWQIWINSSCWKCLINFPHLYMGLVALSLNQRMRKTSPHPDGDWTSQGNTAVVPWRPFTCDTGTESTI